MFQRLLSRLWAVNPLGILGGILGAQVIALQSGLLPEPCSLVMTMLLVMELAYLQNTTYALQSRAGMRNSNLYHLIAAVAASLSFFWSLQLLARNELPPVLLAPYVFATVLATVHGNALSIRIEKALGIYVENLKGEAQFLKLWPSVAVLAAALVWQIIRLTEQGVQVVLSDKSVLALDTGTLVLLVVLGIIGSFTFALLRTARSSDSYWFHAVAFLLNTSAEFAKLYLLFKFRMTWELFIPVTTGSVIGSLLGANMAQSVVERIKAAFDVHVYSKKELAALESAGQIPWPTSQVLLLGGILAVQVFAIVGGVAPLGGSLLLLTLSAWQQMSFTLKSRAGQRNNPRYLAWTSVFSNGVWYLTLAPLAMGGITADEAIPYIIGGAIGSLVGQLAAMHVERSVGAVTDDRPAPAAAPKPATA